MQCALGHPVKCVSMSLYPFGLRALHRKKSMQTNMKSYKILFGNISLTLHIIVVNTKNGEKVNPLFCAIAIAAAASAADAAVAACCSSYNKI